MKQDVCYKLVKENRNYKLSPADKMRIRIFGIVQKMMHTTRNFDIEIINGVNLNNKENVIYVVNHSNCHDIPTIAEISKNHFYLLLGVQKLRIMDRIAFFLLGSKYVDRKNKESKHQVKSDLIDIVNRGNSLLIFPESTWNTTENKLMLPAHWGVIDIAKETHREIKPINLYYTNNKCYVNVGQNIAVDKEDSKESKYQEMMEALSTLAWENMEQLGINKRSSITKDDYKAYSIDRFNEYKPLDVEYEQSIIRKEHDIEEDVLKFFNEIELNENNAFLAKEQLRYKDDYGEEKKSR